MKNISFLLFIFLFIYYNIDITSANDHKPEEFLVSDHSFKSLNQFEVNQTYFKCKICNVNESWSKLVFVTFYEYIYELIIQ